jgi:hypothetical protein
MTDNEQNLLARYRALHDWLSGKLEAGLRIDIDYEELADRLEELDKLRNLADREDQ